MLRVSWFLLRIGNSYWGKHVMALTTVMGLTTCVVDRVLVPVLCGSLLPPLRSLLGRLSTALSSTFRV